MAHNLKRYFFLNLKHSWRSCFFVVLYAWSSIDSSTLHSAQVDTNIWNLRSTVVLSLNKYEYCWETARRCASAISPHAQQPIRTMQKQSFFTNDHTTKHFHLQCICSFAVQENGTLIILINSDTEMLHIARTTQIMFSLHNAYVTLSVRDNWQINGYLFCTSQHLPSKTNIATEG